MKAVIFTLFIVLMACEKKCTLLLHIGEAVKIPIQFNGYSVSELNNLLVIRKSHDSNVKNDTFLLETCLWGHQIKSNSIEITDADIHNKFGYYGSYFNDCDLIFKGQITRDTFKNMVILKSKANTSDKCNQNDPNIRVDKISFEYKGKMINKGELVNMTK